MKKNKHLIYTLILALFSLVVSGYSQSENQLPYSFTHAISTTGASVLSTIEMPYHDFATDIVNAEVFQKNGNYPRFAYHYETNYTLQNSGTQTITANGGKLWIQKFKSTGAIAIALFFDNFYLPEGSLLSVYSSDKKQVLNFGYEHNQGNNLFSTEFITGDEITLEYYEPANVSISGSFRITALAHQYRTLMADPCEVNVICNPEGNNWQDKKRGVCRIYVVEGSQAGYCSGSLINNTSLNCKRYILTAFHCGTAATTANFNQWKFRFDFEATQCTGQADTYGANNTFTGCSKRADSGDNGGTNGSDFLLLEMSSTASPTWWNNVYWNGWNRQTAAPTGGGVGIHHPNGDNKKISVFTANPISTYWQGGSAPNTHWSVTWVATTNGHGVTEGGSSGSPLFNTSGQIFGTLTGGGSFCTSPNSPDAYGKFSYHWASDGTTNALQLKPWLDPANTGATSLNGSYSPCATTGITRTEAATEFTIYPNPSTGIFQLQGTDVSNVKVYSVLGEEILAIIPKQNSNVSIDLSAKANGIYFVVITAKGKSFSKKVLKE